MKNLKLFMVTFLVGIFTGCSPSDDQQVDLIGPVESTVTLHYKEAARSNVTNNPMVSDPRELSSSKDLFTWGDLGKISRNEYPLNSSIEYNKVDKTLRFFHPGILNGGSNVVLMSGNYIVQSFYIDSIGSLVLVLEDDFSGHDLKVRFINQGLDTTVDQDRYLVEITGVYSYISPNTNAYFNKSFSLTFHTIENFSINEDKITVN